MFDFLYKFWLNSVFLGKDANIYMKGGIKALTAILLIGFAVTGCGGKKQSAAWSLDQSPAANQLRTFIAEKKAQAEADAAAKHKELPSGIRRLFSAAENGDAQSVSNLYEDLKSQAPHYQGNSRTDDNLQGVPWQVAKEIWGTFDSFASPEDYQLNAELGRGIIESIPPGSIYFGGTDPGRWVITALQKSHVKGEPFFTLTQNAMADPTYLDYVRGMYGAKIYIPTPNDSQKCFQDYMEDAQRRILHDQTSPAEPKQVKPGEDVRVDGNGHVQVSGQVAVMAINAELVKVIFDQETNREFSVEESFPLDWMFPHLEPHGLIMKINREPLAELPDEIIRRDHEFWTAQLTPLIGDWLKDDTSVQEICAFVQKVYVKHDLTGFKGDPRIAKVGWPNWMSKMRSSIGGVYSWRLGVAPSGGIVPAESIAKDEARDRMIKEADFAFRQAFALAPGSPEAVYRYANFLVNQKRTADAIGVVETAVAVRDGDPEVTQFRLLLTNLKSIRSSDPKNPPGG